MSFLTYTVFSYQQHDSQNYNLRMHKQREQYENKKKEAEEREKPQRNRFNWMLDDIGEHNRKWVWFLLLITHSKQIETHQM